MIRYPDVFANIPQAPWDRMSQPSEAEIVIVGILVMIISVALLIYGIVH